MTPLATWIERSGGIVHRGAALEAGYAVAALRAATADGEVRRIRRYWLATDEAPPPLVAAAAIGEPGLWGKATWYAGRTHDELGGLFS